MRGRLLIVIIAGFLIGALGGATALILTSGAQGPKVQTTGTADIGGPFTLVDQNGKTVTDRDFRGKYMLIFFGFTHCPDICPAELQLMSSALDGLGPKTEEVVPIFVTLDPGRDTPEVVGAYVKNFGKNFVGLTGSPEAIDKVAKAYRVIYQTFEYKGKDGNFGYSIDHSALVYFLGKGGQYLAHFAYGTTAAKMTETMRRYL
jgi:protein SCO1/2